MSPPRGCDSGGDDFALSVFVSVMGGEMLLEEKRRRKQRFRERGEWNDDVRVVWMKCREESMGMAEIINEWYDDGNNKIISEIAGQLVTTLYILKINVYSWVNIYNNIRRLMTLKNDLSVPLLPV